MRIPKLISVILPFSFLFASSEESDDIIMLLHATEAYTGYGAISIKKNPEYEENI